MAAAFGKLVLDQSFPANADLSAKYAHAVSINSSGKIVAVSAAGEKALGILLNEPAAANRAAKVALHGICQAYFGGTVAVDDLLTVDSAGKLVKADDNAEYVIGRALIGGASGEIGTVLVLPSANRLVNPGNVFTFHYNLADLANGDILTGWVPGLPGTISKVSWLTTKAATTAAKAATINLEIGTTDLTGGVISLTSANQTPIGAVVNGTAITAANQFSATDAISVEASAVTAFAEGEGELIVVLK